MELPNLEAHPILLVRKLERLYGGRLELSFSRYIYLKQAIADQREVFWINAPDVTNDWLISTLRTLQPGQELALNSTVQIDGRSYHLPMIDFLGFSGDHYHTLCRIFHEDFVNDLLFFNSGRSFHAYGVEPLTFHAWVQFMGRLLLCNLPELAPVVDQRWIGHRLLGGYAALRWSKNTECYRQYPVFVRDMQHFLGMGKDREAE
jgi:hypothetical protein